MPHGRCLQRRRSARRRTLSIRASRRSARGTSASERYAPAVELKPRDRGPAFSLRDDEGRTVSSKDLLGTRYVVYFYPKDDTPGCTTEACQFTDNFHQFQLLGVPVFGISRDGAASHQKFR